MLLTQYIFLPFPTALKLLLLQPVSFAFSSCAFTAIFSKRREPGPRGLPKDMFRIGHKYLSSISNNEIECRCYRVACSQANVLCACLLRGSTFVLQGVQNWAKSLSASVSARGEPQVIPLEPRWKCCTGSAGSASGGFCKTLWRSVLLFFWRQIPPCWQERSIPSSTGLKAQELRCFSAACAGPQSSDRREPSPLPSDTPGGCQKAKESLLRLPGRRS